MQVSNILEDSDAYRRGLRYQLTVMVTAFLPIFLAGLILQFAQPYYGHDCAGCRDDLVMGIMSIVSVSAILFAVLVTAWPPESLLPTLAPAARSAAPRRVDPQTSIRQPTPCRN